MGRVCTVCSHAQAKAINAALLGGGESQRAIARRFGISRWALGRHFKNHLPAALLKAHAAQEELSADNLLAHVAELRQWARRIAERAERAGDLRGALQGVRTLLKIVEVMGKLKADPAFDSSSLVNIYLPEFDVASLSDAELDQLLAGVRIARAPEAPGEPSEEAGDLGDRVRKLEAALQLRGQEVADLRRELERAQELASKAEKQARRAEEDLRAARAKAEPRGLFVDGPKW